MVRAWITDPLWRRMILLSVVVAVGGAAGFLAASPGAIRPVLAAAAMAAVVGLAAKYPDTLIAVLFAFLPFLGLGRRLLIPVAGWSGTDPLLLIGPVAAVCLLAFRIVRRDVPALWTPLSKGVTLFLLIATVQAGNPLQGSPMVGLGGLMVMVPMLLWYYIGNGVVTEQLVERLFKTHKALAVVVSLYGLYQTFYGLLPVEELWVAIAGYNSLYVGSTLRAISTFVSGAEYASYVVVAAAICVTQAMVHRNLRYLIPLAIYMPALMLLSSRGPIAALTIVSIIAFGTQADTRAAKIKRSIFGAVAGLSILFVMLMGLSLVGKAVPSLAALVDHQVNGLLNPMDEEHSTANLHSDMAKEGIKRGFTNPFGRGVGSITLAADKFGVGMVNWEVDVSNAFYSLGALGGLTLVWIIIWTHKTAWGHWHRSRTPIFLSIAAVLALTTREWWNGGHYVMPPLIWMLIGFVNRSAHEFDTGKGEGTA